MTRQMLHAVLLFKKRLISHFVSSQVFVDKHFIGVLDYKTQELSLPDGKVILCVCVCLHPSLCSLVPAFYKLISEG